MLDQKVLDRVYTVTGQEAFEGARRLANDTGILGGISSGANVYGAYKLARELGENANVVTVLPDTGERYLSTDLFDYA